MKDFKHALRPRLISGKWSIQGTAPIVGRIRRTYPTKESAEYDSLKLIAEVSNKMSAGQVRETCMQPSEERDALLALNILNKDPKLQGKFSSLYELTLWARDKLIDNNFDITISEAGRLLINDLSDRGRAENYLEQISNRVNRFCSLLGDDFLVCDFTRDMVQAWVRGDEKDLSPFAGKETSNTTRTNELTFLKGYFNFARSQGWIKDSPCEGVKGYGKNKNEVVCLDIEKSKEFMKVASDFSPEAECYFALSLYAGLRPEELRPTDGKDQVAWEDFTWRGPGESTLAVGYKVGKVTTRRVIKLPEICVQHIIGYAQDSGPVIQSSYAKWRGIKDYIRAKCGYKVYGQHFKHIDPELAKVSNDTDRPAYVKDVLRHTAISYYLELNPSKDQVAKWAGNSPAVIDQHYRALVKGDKERTPEQYAKDFFKLKS